MFAKKTLLILSFCLFVTRTSLCQDWCDTIIASIKGKKLLSQIQPELKVVKQNAYNFFYRKEDFGVETVCSMCSSNIRDSLKYGSFVFFNIYATNDTIFLVDVATSLKGADFSPIPKFTGIDTMMANQKLASFNAKYSSSWQISNYFKGLDTGLNYQPAVGFFLPPTSLKVFLSILIKTRNHKKLILFASSLYPEIRAFGTVGLSVMKLDGEKITALEEKLISLNQASVIMIGQFDLKVMANYLIDNETDESMSSQLRNIDMEHYYSTLKQEQLL